MSNMKKLCITCANQFSVDKGREDIKNCSLDCRRKQESVGKILIKTCQMCNKLFKRPHNVRGAAWDSRRCCSSKCRNVWIVKAEIGFKKGHLPYSDKNRFLIGDTPWNKGLLGRQPWMNTSGLLRKKGKDHLNWRGGVSSLVEKIKSLRKYREWRTSTFKRDNFTCQFCGQKGGTLHADHIKPFSWIMSDNKVTSILKSKKCLELWDISNGRTLCVACHKKTDTYGYRSVR